MFNRRILCAKHTLLTRARVPRRLHLLPQALHDLSLHFLQKVNSLSRLGEYPFEFFFFLFFFCFSCSRSFFISFLFSVSYSSSSFSFIRCSESFFSQIASRFLITFLTKNMFWSPSRGGVNPWRPLFLYFRFFLLSLFSVSYFSHSFSFTGCSESVFFGLNHLTISHYISL